MTKKTEKEEGSIADAIRKVVSIGVGAAFMTEEAVKNVLGDLPLPKEIVNGLIQNAKSAKENFNDSLREEVRSYLAKVDATKMMDDLVDRYDLEVNATFKFKKKPTKENTNEESDDSDS